MAPGHTEHRVFRELAGGAPVVRPIVLLPHESPPLETNAFDRRIVEFRIGCHLVQLQEGVGDAGGTVRKSGEVAFLQGRPGSETEFVRLAPLQQMPAAGDRCGENLRFTGGSVASQQAGNGAGSAVHGIQAPVLLDLIRPNSQRRESSIRDQFAVTKKFTCPGQRVCDRGQSGVSAEAELRQLLIGGKFDPALDRRQGGVRQGSIGGPRQGFFERRIEQADARPTVVKIVFHGLQGVSLGGRRIVQHHPSDVSVVLTVCFCLDLVRQPHCEVEQLASARRLDFPMVFAQFCNRWTGSEIGAANIKRSGDQAKLPSQVLFVHPTDFCSDGVPGGIDEAPGNQILGTQSQNILVTPRRKPRDVQFPERSHFGLQQRPGDRLVRCIEQLPGEDFEL